MYVDIQSKLNSVLKVLPFENPSWFVLNVKSRFDLNFVLRAG